MSLLTYKVNPVPILQAGYSILWYTFTATLQYFLDHGTFDSLIQNPLERPSPIQYPRPLPLPLALGGNNRPRPLPLGTGSVPT